MSTAASRACTRLSRVIVLTRRTRARRAPAGRSGRSCPPPSPWRVRGRARQVVPEEVLDDGGRPRALGPCRRAEVDVLERGPAELPESAAACSGDCPIAPARSLVSTRSCTSASTLADELGPERPERTLGKVARGEDAGAHGIVDVVVHVAEAVDQADDLALHGRRAAGAGVVQDAVAHLGRQIQPAAVALEHLDHAHRVLVVVELGSVRPAANGRAPPRPCGQTADGRGRGRARSPR